MKRLVLVVMILTTTFVCTGCKEHAEVPPGTTKWHPILINYNCSAIFASKEKLQETQEGKITKNMECPSGSDAPPIEVGLLETVEGDLMWIEMKDFVSKN